MRTPIAIPQPSILEMIEVLLTTITKGIILLPSEFSSEWRLYRASERRIEAARQDLSELLRQEGICF